MTDFTEIVVAWYKRNKRDLPWRNTKDPYKIWVSEVILQQTQVKQGLDYYLRFIEAFPDVTSLAKTPQQQVLKMWQGLGYYSRARNLHDAARYVVDHFNGILPETKNELQQLKGIGPYTAAAIASIAYELPHAVVDGNVYRLLARCFSIPTPVDSRQGQIQFQKLADELMMGALPSDFNQAIMELGALVCTPHNPDCESCPLREICRSYADKDQLMYPVKEKKLVKRERFFNYVIIHDKNGLLLFRREKGDIWQGLYEFFLIEDNALLSRNKIQEILLAGMSGAKEAVNSSFKTVPNDFLKRQHNPDFIIKLEKLIEFGEARHLLTHQHINARFFIASFSGDLPSVTMNEDLSFRYIEFQDLASFPVPRLIDKKLNGFLAAL